MVADVCTYDKKDVTIHVKNPKKTKQKQYMQI